MYGQNYNNNHYFSNLYEPPSPELISGYATPLSANYSLVGNQSIFQSSQSAGFVSPANYNEHLQFFENQGVRYDLLANQVAYQIQNIQGARHAIPVCQAQNNNQVSQGVGYVTQAAAAYPA